MREKEAIPSTVDPDTSSSSGRNSTRAAAVGVPVFVGQSKPNPWFLSRSRLPASIDARVRVRFSLVHCHWLFLSLLGERAERGRNGRRRKGKAGAAFSLSLSSQSESSSGAAVVRARL